MLRHTDTVPVNGRGTAGDPGGSSSASRPKVTGDLDDLLSQASFHLRWRGYDRLEVENYVSWAESELLAARRQADHLLSRYGAASAELELSRRLLAQAPKGDRNLSSVSERVTEILRLAGDEAAATVEAASQEADQILAGARLEGGARLREGHEIKEAGPRRGPDARLRKAHEIKEAAVAAADQLRGLARTERAQAVAALGQARAQAANLVGDAQAEHARLSGQLAETRTQLTAVQTELEDLQRRRDEARELLNLLTDRIGQALAAVGDATGERFVVVGNRVQALPT